MNKKTFFKLTTLLTSFLLVSFLSYAFKKEINVSNPLNKHMKKILISGSSITQTLCENLSESFLKNNPEIYFNKSSIGSADALNSILKNTSNIGDISKNLTESELKKVNIKTFALDGIVVCVNPQNKVLNLTLENLKKIFSGKIRNWKQLGGEDGEIVLVGRDNASGIRESFEKTLNLKETNYTVELDNNGKVKFKIQKDCNAIGYISFSTLDENIKAIKINGITPCWETIKNNTYPFFQPLSQITKLGVEDETVKRWFSFVNSEEGFNIIKKNKFIPLPF